ncbi:hypothetical protein ACW2AB_00375 [Limosilactobacillus fermentum]
MTSASGALVKDARTLQERADTATGAFPAATMEYGDTFKQTVVREFLRDIRAP